MKIVTLGTSHGDPTKTRDSSSTLVEAGGRRYLVDAGEPVAATLIRRGVEPSRVNAAFVTHLHIDHAGGVPMLVLQAIKYRRDNPDATLEVLLPDPRGVEGFRHWAEALSMGDYESRGARVSAYGPGEVFDDGVLRVEAFPNRHIAGGGSYSLRLSAEGKRVFFSGDLSGDFGDFPLAAATGCDLVFSELTHYPLEKALPILERLKTGRLIFYHLHNPYQTPEGGADALRRAAALPYPVHLAHDGMETSL